MLFRLILSLFEMQQCKSSKFFPRLCTDNKPMKIVVALLLKMIIFAVALGALLRFALLFNPVTEVSSVSALQIAGCFVVGAINDFCVILLLLAPLMLMLISTGRRKYVSTRKYVVIGLVGCLLLWLIFGADRLNEFNRSLHKALIWICVYWLAVFCLRAFVPRIRNAWTRFWLILITVAYVGLLVFNCVGEWLFWDEFGVRYNFIAVDYIIYTTEVIGNIRESYPVGWLSAVGIAVSAILSWLIFRKQFRVIDEVSKPGWRGVVSIIYVVLALLSMLVLGSTSRVKSDKNKFVSELQASGICSFCQAFRSNELDYKRFYLTISPSEVKCRMHRMFAGRDNSAVTDSIVPARYNIVLITMESMSASYLQHFGETRHLTPTLDTLYNHSIAFERMFAVGNRTVRGLEALTLSRPPSPGESIIKRPDNAGFPSISGALDSNGYRKIFFYGGDSYFDNMESFYRNLGYEICDKKSFAPEEINFETVWGICDEDVFVKMLNVLDDVDRSGAPFMAHVMTTSNHRPYTYPEGKIAISPSTRSRAGGVMYADYSIGRFLEMAKGKRWFKNTIFVFCADHCASSAGKVDIPLGSYHIPALIYAPAIVKPQRVSFITSQVDLMPTVFGIMGWKPDKRLYGFDIFSPDYTPRAYVATYQDMGYLEKDTLTVLSPRQRIKQFKVNATPDDPFRLDELTPSLGSNAARRSIAVYQSCD